MKTSTKPWAIYTRVSTEEQAQEGVSLDAQAESCRMYLQSQGKTPGPVYCDGGFTGRNIDRPKFKKMIKGVEDGVFDGIVVWQLSRLSRNLADLIKLANDIRSWGAHLCSVRDSIDTSTAMGTFIFQFTGALAELESNQTSERVRHAIMHMRLSGQYTGGRLPVGLRVITKEDGGRYEEADPDHAEKVATCWKIVHEGKPLSAVVEHLQATGVPLPSGAKRWHKNAVSRMLSNKRYIGRLITQEQFDSVRETLSQRWTPTQPNGTHTATVTQSDRLWRLKGIGRCAFCGASLCGRSVSNGTHRYPYLYCSGRDHDPKSCQMRDLPADPWENLVVEAVIKHIRSPELLADLTQAVNAHQDRQQALKEEHTRRRVDRDALQQRINQLLEPVESGQVPMSAVRHRIQELGTQLTEANVKLAQIEADVARVTSSKDSAAYAAEVLQNAVDGLESAPWEVQSQVLHGLVKEVHLGWDHDLKVVLDIPVLQKPTENTDKNEKPPREGGGISRVVRIGDVLRPWGKLFIRLTKTIVYPLTLLRDDNGRRRPFLGRLPTKADWQYILAQPYRQLAVVLGVSPRQAQRYKRGHGSEVKLAELIEDLRRRGTLVVPVETKAEKLVPLCV